jgi:hypothetical protein
MDLVDNGLTILIGIAAAIVGTHPADGAPDLLASYRRGWLCGVTPTMAIRT